MISSRTLSISQNHFLIPLPLPQHSKRRQPHGPVPLLGGMGSLWQYQVIMAPLIRNISRSPDNKDGQKSCPSPAEKHLVGTQILQRCHHNTNLGSQSFGEQPETPFSTKRHLRQLWDTGGGILSECMAQTMFWGHKRKGDPTITNTHTGGLFIPAGLRLLFSNTEKPRQPNLRKSLLPLFEN